MDTYLLLIVIALGAFALKTQDQRRRIALLGSHLQNYQIEHLMESLSDGYLRALDADDPVRREQVWGLMAAKELDLNAQFQRLAADIGRVEPSAARVSTFPLAIPFADRLFPAASFPLREAFAIHARGIDRAIQNADGLDPKAKAFRLSAEMFLMQHTCHWFCRSKAVASARLLARHKTTYDQVLAAVSPDTRRAYRALIGKA